MPMPRVMLWTYVLCVYDGPVTVGYVPCTYVPCQVQGNYEIIDCTSSANIRHWIKQGIYSQKLQTKSI